MAELGLRVLAALGGAPALSPLSLHAALATLRTGAGGRTRAALDELLGPGEPDAIDLAGEDAVELLRAQSLWIDRSGELRPEFAVAARERGVRTGTLDFADPGAPAQVNAWAAEQTRGMVPRVLSSFARDERLVLADALYFDGAWTVPFDPAATAAEPFRRSDGTSRDVPMMHARGRMEHAQAGELEAIRLAYGDTGKLRFWAVAGPAGGPPAAPALDAAAWGALRARLRPAQGSLALPRLRLDADLDLRPALVALGLGAAFEPSRDLDGVLAVPGAEPIALGRVLQRARVDVDEAGTRAAAVTTITAIAVSAMVDPPAPFDLRFDRPFVWGIEAAETGTLLFVGVVEDPGTA